MSMCFHVPIFSYQLILLLFFFFWYMNHESERNLQLSTAANDKKNKQIPQINTESIKRRAPVPSPVSPLTLDTLLTLLPLAPNQQQQRESINISPFFLHICFFEIQIMMKIQSEIYSHYILSFHPYLNLDLMPPWKHFFSICCVLTWGFISLHHLMEDLGLCLAFLILEAANDPVLSLHLFAASYRLCCSGDWDRDWRFPFCPLCHFIIDLFSMGGSRMDVCCHLLSCSSTVIASKVIVAGVTKCVHLPLSFFKSLSVDIFLLTLYYTCFQKQVQEVKKKSFYIK